MVLLVLNSSPDSPDFIPGFFLVGHCWRSGDYCSSLAGAETQTRIRDKILVVRTTDQYQSTPRERIIIPKDFVPSVVSQLHQSLKCPPMAQLSKVMERYFFGIGMGTAIADAKKYCYICTADRKFPDQLQVYQPVNQPKHPGICFNADVLQRSKQKILVIRDLFSCLTAATFVQSEKALDLKDGIIQIIQPIRAHGRVDITVDNDSGMASLVKNPNPALSSLGINMHLGSKLNKNSIATVTQLIGQYKNLRLK
jgi:hypothetical protein